MIHGGFAPTAKQLADAMEGVMWEIEDMARVREYDTWQQLRDFQEDHPELTEDQALQLYDSVFYRLVEVMKDIITDLREDEKDES